MTREPESMQEATMWLFQYFYNVPNLTIVKAVYGEDTDPSYLNGKADEIARRGPGPWWAELDLPNQKRLAEAIKARYGIVTEPEDPDKWPDDPENPDWHEDSPSLDMDRLGSYET